MTHMSTPSPEAGFVTNARLEVRITAKTTPAAGIACYHLAAADGKALPGFTAGAHVHVYLSNGMVRQYSLCNPSEHPDDFVIAVQDDPQSRGGSRHIHQSWKVGYLVEISAPLNHFALVPGAPALLLAAGIGVTPILAMARELADAGLPFQLHYAARSPETAVFVDEILAAAAQAQIHYSDGAAPNRLDLAACLSVRQPDQHIYACGPARFIDEILAVGAAQGIPADHLHREFFAPPQTQIAPTDSFELHLAKSDITVTVQPGTTVLEAIAAAGVDVPASCEVGVCGTCVLRVLEGTPDHQDVYLDDAEHAANDRFTPCCSWSKTARLVVDI
jgi:vanillate O-demethylase ferredoxin subunit